MGKVKNFKFRFVILLFAFCALNFVGCARMKECAKGIAGISTEQLEKSRKGAIVKQFNLDYDTCYAKTKQALNKAGSYIYAQGKDMFAVYLSTTDTTPVGLFFKKIDAQNTQIEVSSQSAYAREVLSKKVFAILENKPMPQTEEGKENAEK